MKYCPFPLHRHPFEFYTGGSRGEDPRSFPQQMSCNRSNSHIQWAWLQIVSHRLENERFITLEPTGTLVYYQLVTVSSDKHHVLKCSHGGDINVLTGKDLCRLNGLFVHFLKRAEIGTFVFFVVECWESVC